MEILGLLNVPNCLLYIVVFIIVAYIYYTWEFGLFTNMGVPGPKPYPILGNMHLFFKHGFMDTDKMLISQYGKIVGMFFGRQPRLIIGDVDILRRILIKDFNNFQDRDKMPLRGILRTSLVDARGDYWKDLRHLLTPAFTTGKLKQMMPLIRACSDRFVKNIGEKCKNNEELEAKEHCGAFTMDVISGTAFGLDVDSQKNKDDPFVRHVMKILNIDIFNPWIIVIVFAPFLVPVLEKFGVQLLPSNSMGFFENVAKEIIKQRKQGKENRVDIMQMMLEAHQHLMEEDEEMKEDLKATVGHSKLKNTAELSETDIIAQSVQFFVAGYDTTANTLSFLMYSMAVNQHLQDKLCAEIDEVIGDKDPSHDDLYKLPYLDMCICETLRMYPPVQLIDRQASKDFEYNGVKVPKGTVVNIPIRALHIDPEAWPEPNKFDPERFTPEAKASLDNMYFMPFGLGPRQCIGMRLALLEMKLVLVKLFRQYRVVTCSQTQIPLRFKKTLLANSEKGIWVKVESRK